MLPDGKRVALNIVFSDQAAGLMFFQPFLQDREKGTIRFTPPQFGSAALKLGQAVVALSSDEGNAVSTGIIANLVTKARGESAGGSAGEKETALIKTDIRSADLVLGSVLLNLSGEVIGVNAGASIGASRNTFLPIHKVQDALAKASIKSN